MQALDEGGDNWVSLLVVWGIVRRGFLCRWHEVGARRFCLIYML